MAHELRFEADRVARRDFVDFTLGDHERAVRRAQLEAYGFAGQEWLGEAYHFTMDEYEFLQKIRPDLFDKEVDPHVMRRRWIRWGNTSQGQRFRVR